VQRKNESTSKYVSKPVFEITGFASHFAIQLRPGANHLQFWFVVHCKSTWRHQ